MTTVEVRAPATTANLGPGYDCLGMALDIWNRLTVSTLPAGSTPTVQVNGEGEGELAGDTDNLTYRAMAFLYDEADTPIPPLELVCQNGIPLSRGMGSSAAAIAGGLVAANALLDEPFSANDLLEMAATIEGHPDNVAAAVHGGLRLVVMEDNQIYTAPIRIPAELQAVLFIPENRIATVDARRVLPAEISVADAVYNMSRAALLVAAMEGNRPEYLKIATQDRLHQPYRETIFPPMKVIFAAARDAGALGVFLSGSGSAIMALTQERAMTVAYEMFDAARLCGVEGRVEVTTPTELGAHVVSVSSND
ncbi:Homoserine kinase [Geodia barretti]|jgi:homoserine kinase|uniref:Homoserine kinase n=3 Tax=Geodia barretti TaxID=519541 RepID=A0AA35W9V9_GEOBA|nr:Homoserine kinase [Geodia barretti]